MKHFYSSFFYFFADILALTSGQGKCGNCCTFCCIGPCCPCVMTAGRVAVRQKYGLPEDPCSDCCIYFWCTNCAICMDLRELKNRGVYAYTPATPAPQVIVVQQAAPAPVQYA